MKKKKFKCNSCRQNFLLGFADEDVCPNCGSYNIEKVRSGLLASFEMFFRNNKWIILISAGNFVVLGLLYFLFMEEKEYILQYEANTSGCYIEVKLTDKSGNVINDKDVSFKDGLNGRVQEDKRFVYPENGEPLLIYAVYSGSDPVKILPEVLNIPGYNCVVENPAIVDKCDNCNTLQVTGVKKTKWHGSPAIKILALPAGCDIEYSIDGGKTYAKNNIIHTGSIEEANVFIRTAKCPAVDYSLNPVLFRKEAVAPVKLVSKITDEELEKAFNLLINNPSDTKRMNDLCKRCEDYIVEIDGSGAKTSVYSYCQKLRNPNMIKNVRVLRVTGSVIIVKEIAGTSSSS